MMIKNWKKTKSHISVRILEDIASGVQAGDIEQVIVHNLFKVP